MITNQKWHSTKTRIKNLCNKTEHKALPENVTLLVWDTAERCDLWELVASSEDPIKCSVMSIYKVLHVYTYVCIRPFYMGSPIFVWI